MEENFRDIDEAKERIGEALREMEGRDSGWFIHLLADGTVSEIVSTGTSFEVPTILRVGGWCVEDFEWCVPDDEGNLVDRETGEIISRETATEMAIEQMFEQYIEALEESEYFDEEGNLLEYDEENLLE